MIVFVILARARERAILPARYFFQVCFISTATVFSKIFQFFDQFFTTFFLSFDLNYDYVAMLNILKMFEAIAHSNFVQIRKLSKMKMKQS